MKELFAIVDPTIPNVIQIARRPPRPDGYSLILSSGVNPPTSERARGRVCSSTTTHSCRPGSTNATSVHDESCLRGAACPPAAGRGGPSTCTRSGRLRGRSVDLGRARVADAAALAAELAPNPQLCAGEADVWRGFPDRRSEGRSASGPSLRLQPSGAHPWARLHRAVR
jgi:hypothetical protein